MEPGSVVLVAGATATTGWLLGRASASPSSGSSRDTSPGQAIADTGTRISRQAAYGFARRGSRALMWSAAGLALGGSVVARSVGGLVDGCVSTAASLGGLTQRRLRRPEQPQVSPPAAEGLPATEPTRNGIEVPAGAEIA
jgi:hypothetical protein